jgi:L-amino acid N-acyltransferase YncA
MSSTTLRVAHESDAPAIAAIYNEGIEDRLATLETELRSADERRAWLDGHGGRYPVFVAERDGSVVAWGSLNRFNPRPAYDHVVDFSIYVGRAARGHGIGRLLLAHLIEQARALGFHKMVLAAFPENAAGMRLYESMGFKTVGVYREQGILDGRWADVIVMEQILA